MMAFLDDVKKGLTVKDDIIDCRNVNCFLQIYSYWPRPP